MPLNRTRSDSSEESKARENYGTIEVIPVSGLPRITPSDNIAALIFQSIKKNQQELRKRDIIVIAHTVVSIAEGKLVQTTDIVVSSKAEKLALSNERKPTKIQAAINEAQEIIREEPVLITRTKHGFITDMSGIDESNAPEGYYVLLPDNPDKSADEISKLLSQYFGFRVPVIITDTQGRPWRRGAVNLAIGVAGMSPFTVNAGQMDLFGRELKSSLVCIADELAAASELVMGQANEGIPVAIIRGIDWTDSEEEAKDILREKADDLF